MLRWCDGAWRRPIPSGAITAIMSNASATETDSESLVYTLDSPATVPLISQVGGKGLSLIDCFAAGFPVPPGFVLSVAFFQSWLDSIKNTREWNKFTEDPSKQACDERVMCSRKHVSSFSSTRNKKRH